MHNFKRILLIIFVFVFFCTFRAIMAFKNQTQLLSSLRDYNTNTINSFIGTINSTNQRQLSNLTFEPTLKNGIISSNRINNDEQDGTNITICQQLI